MADVSDIAIIVSIIIFAIAILMVVIYVCKVISRKNRRIEGAQVSGRREQSGNACTRAQSNSDVEQRERAVTGQGTPCTGESYYTVDGPGGEVHLAYYQGLPERFLDLQHRPSHSDSESSPLVALEPSTNTPHDPSDLNNDTSPPAPPAVLTPDETAAAILALQQEVQRLRTRLSHQIDLAPPSQDQDQDPFLTPPIPIEGSQSRVSDSPVAQEHAMRRRLETLEAEVERLRAHNAVLILAQAVPSSPPAYQPRERYP